MDDADSDSAMASSLNALALEFFLFLRPNIDPTLDFNLEGFFLEEVAVGMDEEVPAE